jgi:hypothetical protein
MLSSVFTCAFDRIIGLFSVHRRWDLLHPSLTRHGLCADRRHPFIPQYSTNIDTRLLLNPGLFAICSSRLGRDPIDTGPRVWEGDPYFHNGAFEAAMLSMCIDFSKGTSLAPSLFDQLELELHVVRHGCYPSSPPRLTRLIATA